MRSILVMGGTGFIGRHFVETLVQRHGISVTLANRGTAPGLFPELERIAVDRENIESCRTAFASRSWDHVFDFSGTNYRRVLNCVTTLDVDHYTYLSSSAVDLATPDDPYLSMAQEKLWCEHVIRKGFDSLAFRAAFVVGGYDNTGRFELRDPNWVWRGTGNIVRPAIEVEQLVSSMISIAFTGHCGVVRAGYSEVTF